MSYQEVQNKLPEPSVNQEKRFFAEESILIGKLAQEVEDIENAIILEKTADVENKIVPLLEKGKYEAYKKFYSEAKGLMRVLRPHLVEGDIAEYDTIWMELSNVENPKRYTIIAVDGLCSFLLQSLKNSNLSELGTKSRIMEILGEIDIGGI